MNHSFEIIASLQCSLKAATAQVEAFKSGKKNLNMQKAHRETVIVRNQWFEVFENLKKEHAKELAPAVKKEGQLEKRTIHAETELEKA